MIDLTTEFFWHCGTFEQFGPAEVQGSEGAIYHVEFGPVQGQVVQRNWTCTCPGFQFKGACKHIEEVRPRRCGWSQFIDGGEAVIYVSPYGVHCPKCGNECQSMGWGV